MAQELKNNNSVVKNSSEWSGMTIEELKFKRAIVLIKLEIQKGVVMNRLQTEFPNGINSSENLIQDIGRKLSFTQYIILGIKGYKIAKNIFGLTSRIKSSFKRNK